MPDSMVTVKRKCPACGCDTESKIRIDRHGNPYYVCENCGVVVYDRNWYLCPVNEWQFQKLMLEKKPEGHFLYDTGIEIIGAVIKDGEIETEEFPDEVECLSWLIER